MVNLILSAQAPTGFWPSIIQFFNNAFVNYTVAIIMLTLCIKLILLPFDFLNKSVARKNQKVQVELAPELTALQKKYENNKEMLNQKTQELYKKHNVNLGGSCFIMLINLVVTFTVFLTLFSGLNTMATYKLTSQYEQLERTYISVEYSGDYGELTSDQIKAYVETISADAGKTQTANLNVSEKYQDIKDSWLWIGNIWLADSPFAKKIPTFDQYVSNAKLKFETQTEKDNLKYRYETIMNPLAENGANQGVNGYLILTILTIATSLVMQLGTQKGWFRKKRYRKELKNQPTQMNAMLIMLPLLMGYFTLFYNSVFSVYIVVGQIFGLITSPLIDLILDTREEKKQEKANINKGRIVR